MKLLKNNRHGKEVDNMGASLRSQTGNDTGNRKSAYPCRGKRSDERQYQQRMLRGTIRHH